MQAGNYSEAEKAYARASELDTSGNFLTGLAEVLARQGRLCDAITVLRNFLSKRSGNPHVHAKLGHLLWRQSDFQGAEAAYRNAVEIDPSPSFYLGVADCVAKQGRYEEAIAIVEDVVAAGFEDARAFHRLGQWLSRSDRSSCEVALRRAIALDPHPDYLISLADCVANQGRKKEAVSVLGTILKGDIKDGNLLGRVGLLLLDWKDFEGAENALKRALALSPHATYESALARAKYGQNVGA